MKAINHLWQRWQRLGRAIGDAIGRLFFSLFYFTLFAPFSLIARLIGQDPLQLDHRVRAQWRERHDEKDSLPRARRLS